MLSFDKISVSDEWSYDKGTIYGPKKKKIQCVMLRGVTKAWKEFDYYNFDQDRTVDLLHVICVKLKAAGFFYIYICSAF